jgi:CRP-like cAMP-binding protein
MLSEAEATAFWELFKDTPLFTGWPEAKAQISLLIAPVALPANHEVFRSSDAPVSLFFVVRGRVEETFREEGRAWLMRVFVAGQYFGQEALFTEVYQSRAVASPDAQIYRMSAATLRQAMEVNPELFEELLHERRAIRLRRIPLFRSLADAQVRALAHVIEERSLGAGAALTLTEDNAGIWIIDLGQVEVTGSANPYPADWPRWALTAGNFFVAPGAELRFGRHCAAQSAQGRLPTRFFFLPAAHADRLIAAMPDVSAVVQRPLTIPDILPRGDPFVGLTERQRQHLAQVCGWEFVPKEQTITTQGSVGHSFVVLRDGAAVVLATDDRGHPRPRNYLMGGNFYGATSLLEGRRRDASVRAVKAADQPGQPSLNGAEIITLDRRDLRFAIDTNPTLWPAGTPLRERLVSVKEEKQPFDWMDEGETLLWTDRPHPLFLWLPEGLIAALTLLIFALIGLLPIMLEQPLGIFSLVCLAPAAAFAEIFIFINYWDDYYAVTNRRVTRRDRQILLFYEARTEAPMDMIQDATQKVGFWGQVFGYGDVRISTAARADPMVFSKVPNPRNVQAKIMSGRHEALVAGRGQQKEIFRRELIAGLGLVLPTPQRSNALGDGINAGPVARPGCLPGLSQVFPAAWRKWLRSLFTVQVDTTPQQTIWRKHWIKLLQRELWPTTALLGLIAIVVYDVAASFLSGVDILAQILLAGSGIGIAIAAGAIIYQYFDWRNDLYIVTDELLIDVEKTPLWLSEDRKETTLDRIQTVNAKQDGFWRIVLGYGDVMIRTAAANEVFDFLYVPNPKFVQDVISRKRDQYRFRLAQQAALARKQELIESLEVYHQIQQGRNR